MENTGRYLEQLGGGGRFLAHTNQMLQDARQAALVALNAEVNQSVELPIDSARIAMEMGLEIYSSEDLANVLNLDNHQSPYLMISGYDPQAILEPPQRERIAYLLGIYLFNFCPNGYNDTNTEFDLMSDDAKTMARLFVLSLLAPNIDVNKKYSTVEIMRMAKDYEIPFYTLRKELISDSY